MVCLVLILTELLIRSYNTLKIIQKVILIYPLVFPVPKKLLASEQSINIPTYQESNLLYLIAFLLLVLPQKQNCRTFVLMLQLVIYKIIIKIYVYQGSESMCASWSISKYALLAKHLTEIHLWSRCQQKRKEEQGSWICEQARLGESCVLIG